MHLGLHYREESEGRRVSHTPGPWVFNGHHIYGPKHEDSKHPNGRVFVASVARGIHRADPLLDGGADRFGFDSEADVRLIAAAPDLLEALENCLGFVVAHPQFTEDLRNLIAKARGES